MGFQGGSRLSGLLCLQAACHPEPEPASPLHSIENLSQPVVRAANTGKTQLSAESAGDKVAAALQDWLNCPEVVPLDF